jgi:hypothetical protein
MGSKGQKDGVPDNLHSVEEKFPPYPQIREIFSAISARFAPDEHQFSAKGSIPAT